MGTLALVAFAVLDDAIGCTYEEVKREKNETVVIARERDNL